MASDRPPRARILLAALLVAVLAPVLAAAPAAALAAAPQDSTVIVLSWDGMRHDVPSFPRLASLFARQGTVTCPSTRCPHVSGQQKRPGDGSPGRDPRQAAQALTAILRGLTASDFGSRRVSDP